MSYRRLFVFCEGDDDQRFFEEVCAPPLRQHYRNVTFYRYAQKAKKEVRNFLRSLHQMNERGLAADHLYLRDFDHGASIPSRKDRVQELYDEVQRDRIVLVVQMIEGWYAAGVAGDAAAALGVKEMRSTDDMPKSQFDAWIPDRFGGSRIDFMQELLKHFDRSAARDRNRSFDYFCTTFLP